MAINKPVRQAKRLQQKAPLLAELITAEPIADFNADAEYQNRQAVKDASTQSMRNFHAKTWRKARQRFFALDGETQQAITKQWAWLTRNHLPANSVYFAGLVDKISGDQAKRLEKCEAEYQAWKAKKSQGAGVQIDLFGGCA